ncbi:MAG: tetratricopeptide repeat protein [Hyphomonadaceae bacterium]|nr:tetratricopeptide repeat protein [Hyphomonadaceae bacterium]
MTDVFEEIEEEVRRDRYAEWARKYGPWALGVVAALALGFAGFRLYEGYQRGQSQDRSAEFAAALKLVEEGKQDEAAAVFETLSKDGPQAFRLLSTMQRAGILAEKGDLAAAREAFDAAAEAARDPIVRDTARLRAAYLVAETQDFAAVRARLEPIIAEGGAVSFLARELLGAEAWEAGERDLARETFQALSDAFNAPESVRQRAQIALAVIGPAETAPDAAAPTAADAAPTPAAETAPAAAGEKQ